MADTKGTTRRAMLLASLGAPAAAAAVATGAEPAEARRTDDAGNALMRDTEHTRAYFDTARF